MRNPLEIVCLSVVLLGASAGFADANTNHVGIRGGVTDGPDTIYGGLQLTAGSHGTGLRIQPSFEVGVGDFNSADFFMLRANGHLQYALALAHRGQFVYPLVGVSVSYFNYEYCDDCADTDVGVDVGGGFEVSRVNFELVAGIGDIPRLSVAVSLHL